MSDEKNIPQGNVSATKVLSTIRDGNTGEVIGMTEGAPYFVSSEVGSPKNVAQIDPAATSGDFSATGIVPQVETNGPIVEGIKNGKFASLFASFGGGHLSFINPPTIGGSIIETGSPLGGNVTAVGVQGSVIYDGPEEPKTKLVPKPKTPEA